MRGLYEKPNGAADVSVAITGISAGEKYWACRNTGWHLLTCRELVPYGTKPAGGFVVPQENAYFYDLHECFKAQGTF